MTAPGTTGRRPAALQPLPIGGGQQHKSLALNNKSLARNSPAKAVVVSNAIMASINKRIIVASALKEVEIKSDQCRY
jgi:hypothetical protein